MLAFDRMTRGQMPVRVPALEQGAGFVRPFFIAKRIQVISQIPRNIRECGEPRSRVMQIAVLVIAASDGLRRMSGDILNDRYDHIMVAGESEHPLPLLPIGNVKASKVHFRVVETFWRMSQPRPKEQSNILPGHHRFAP